MSSYPGTIISFTQKSGGSPLSSPDHAQNHNNIQDEIVAIETVIGTTAGTNVLKDFSAGQFPVRVNSGGSLVQAINGATIGTSSINGGTINNPTMGSPAVVGGTFTTPIINSGTLTSPTMNIGSDAAMDIYYRSSGGSLQRLPAGTAGQFLQTNGTGTAPSWSSQSPNNYAYNAIASYTSSGTTFASVDGTNLKGTVVTTNSNKVRVLFSTTVTNSVSNATYFQIVRNPAGVPGTPYSGAVQEGTLSVALPISASFIDNPSSGTNVYDVQVKVSAGTASIGAGIYSVNFSIEEIKAG